MAKRAWYARTTWTDADREGFLAQLRAVVGANEQAACLRKQAAHLLKAGTPATLAGARELYELLLAQFPDSSDLAYVHTALGEVLEAAGDAPSALAAYRAALAAQRGTTRSTDAHLRFGLLVLRTGRDDLFAEAAAMLEAAGQPLVYPFDQYRHCGILAHLRAARGEAARARLSARDALAATKHCAVDAGSDFHRRLEELAR